MVARSEAERMAQGLDDLAKAFDGSGLGQHPVSGHSAILKRMAQSVRADAAVGKTPYSWSDSSLYAAAGTGTSTLPLPVLHDLRCAGLETLAQDGETISLQDLNASFRETGVDPSARLRIKSALASTGRLTT
jgi:hypothetical protein